MFELIVELKKKTRTKVKYSTVHPASTNSLNFLKRNSYNNINFSTL